MAFPSTSSDCVHFKHFAFTSNCLPLFSPLLLPRRPSLTPPFVAAAPTRRCAPAAQIW